MNIQKAKYILPNLFTLGSVFLGLQSILWSVEGLFPAAATAILGAAVLDGMDGRVARLTKTQSEFGAQLDSLADAISFGVAPAILTYFYRLDAAWLGRVNVGLLVVAVFAICGILRLARFNVIAMRGKESANSSFVGMPIPLAAALVALSVLSYERSGMALLGSGAYYVVIMLALGALMVSTVRYPSFKKSSTSWSKRRIAVASLGAALILLGVKVVSLYPFLLLVGVTFTSWALLDSAWRLLAGLSGRAGRDEVAAPDFDEIVAPDFEEPDTGDLPE